MDNYKYKFFDELKNRNIRKEKIIELISNASRKVEKITDLKRYNKDLLFFACFNDNETLFEYLTENYKENFQSTYKECIFFTYINKNPQILKIALNALPKLEDAEKLEYIERFSLNCYRKENNEVITEWMNKNLNSEEKNIFVQKLYQNNNRPFLEHLSCTETFKSLILNIQLNDKNQKDMQEYLKRYSQQKQKNNSVLNTENTEPKKITELEPSENNLIVKRKKRLINNQ